MANPTIDDAQDGGEAVDTVGDDDGAFEIYEGLEDWDDDYVYVPEDRGVARKVGVAVALVLAFVVILGAIGVGWVRNQIYGASAGEAVTVIIPKDAGLATVSRLLEEKGVVANATVFRYYAKSQDLPPVRAGEYDNFYRNDSLDHVVQRLRQGPKPPKFSEVTFPEGLWLADTVRRMKEKYPEMSDQAIQQAVRNIQKSRYQPNDKPLDGFLFPATYRVEDPDKDNPQKLLSQMTQKFDQVADEIGLETASTSLAGVAGKTPIGPYEVLTVASLVEGEAKVDEDRARVARVIYNRLAKGMKLEIDATVPFALGEHKQELTKTDLDVNSPYNTRKFPGLPPSPINSPGEKSLRAAMAPSGEPGADRWLYYVLIDEAGHHFFTGDYNQFLRAQADARAKGLI